MSHGPSSSSSAPAADAKATAAGDASSRAAAMMELGRRTSAVRFSSKPTEERKEGETGASEQPPAPFSPPRPAPFSPPHSAVRLLRHRSTPTISPVPSLLRLRTEALSPSPAGGAGDDEATAAWARRRQQLTALPSLLHSSLLPANLYAQQRTGAILSRAMILKSDHFTLPSSGAAAASSASSSSALELHVLGAPNLQQIRPFFIFGVGQPSISGVRAALNMVRARQPHPRHVQWLCLREEPIVYVNNRPFVLRELEAPFHNLSDLQGIDSHRVEQLEARLKADILHEAAEHDGNVLVHDELTGEVRACWESCDAATVRTTREVFSRLQQHDGYQVRLVRLPITAESALDPRQVDAIVLALVEETAQTAGRVQSLLQLQHCATQAAPSPSSSHSDMLHIQVVNDQAGRGRAALGMIIAYLLQSHMMEQQPAPPAAPQAADSSHDGLGSYHRGDWDIILKLCRLLRNGQQAKRAADAAIDACGRVHHIREAIVAAFIRSEHARGETQHRQLQLSTVAALNRYFSLICFASYLQELPAALTPAFLQSHSFHHFLLQHAELTALASSLQQEDGVDELLVNAPAEVESGALLVSPDDSASAAECGRIDGLVFERSGSVLSKRTILKSEYWRAAAKARRGGGSAVFYRHHLPGLPLSAMAQPDVAGIRRILSELAEERLANTGHGLQAGWRRQREEDGSEEEEEGQTAAVKSPLRIIWINLREEPVVFLSGQPYLVRDVYHPFRILSEWTTGMTPQRSEQVEDRLKADIVSELQRSAARPPQLLVHDETAFRQLRPRFLTLDGEEQDVQTTREVFASLAAGQSQAQHGLLQYHRIPMHVEEVVGIASFDRLFRVLHDAQLTAEGGQPAASVVFHDQKGGRRATVGLLIACLVMTYQGCLDLQLVKEKREEEEEEEEEQQQQQEREREHPHQQLGVTASTDAPDPSSMPISMASSRSMAAAGSVTSPPASDAYRAPPIDLSSESAGGSAAPLKRAVSVVAVDSSAAHDELSRTGRGEHKAILSLIRILKRGRQVKEEVDLAIDLCDSGDYNVRAAIAAALAEHEMERTGGTRKTQLMEAAKHAESYAMLIIFHAYLRERRERETEQQAERTAADDSRRQQQEDDRRRRAAAAVAEADEERRHTEEIETEKQAEQAAHHAALQKLQRDQEIDASQITDYNLFNPYITAAARASDGRDSEQSSSSPTPAEDEADMEPQPMSATTSPPLQVRNTAQPLPGHLKHSSSASLPVSAAPAAPAFPSFSSWLHDRPELRLVLRFIRHEPEEALKLNATRLSMHGDFAAAFERRDGNVLVRGSLLKSDHFAGVMHAAVKQLVEGAVNFRPVIGFPVAGTGIPRADGIRRILDFFTRGPQREEEAEVRPLFRASSLLWLNLREEPLLYVNGRPFVLRDGDNPYANLEHTGITPRRVEAMEKQLKLDAWKEAEDSGDCRLLLHDEDDNGNVVCLYEKIDRDSLRTPKEEFYAAFQQVQDDCSSAAFTFSARYFRTPITDEQAPSPAALDAMIGYLEEGREEACRQIVCNCQMGRGRTTTGLIIACLWCLHRGVVTQHDWAATVNRQRSDEEQAAQAASAATLDSAIESAGLSPALASSLRSGWYRVISSLCRLLPAGARCKEQVDAVIDQTSAMQNLRTVVLELQLSAMTCLPKKRPFFTRRGSNFLIRYFFLIAINAYLAAEAQSADGYRNATFVHWLNQRPEILSLLKKIDFPQLSG